MEFKKVFVRKIPSLLLFCCLIFNNISVCYGASANKSDDNQLAWIEFEKFEHENISKYQFSRSTPQSVKKGGKMGIQFETSDSLPYVLLIDIDDNFLYEETDADAIVSVEYFDEGYGTFSLTHGINGGSKMGHDVVKLENTKKWRTHDFYIKEGAFCNIINNDYDLWIGTWTSSMSWSPEPVILGGVKIQKLPAKILRTNITTEHTGNIFDDDDEIEFRVLTEKNYDEQVEASFRFKVIDSKGVCVEDQTETFIITENSTQTHTSKITEKGSYTLEYVCNATDSAGRILEKSGFTYFSVVDKFEANESLNQDFGLGGLHSNLYYQNSEQQNKLMEVLRQSGGGWTRDGLKWTNGEKEKGKYVIPDFGYNVARLKDVGIKTIFNFSEANSVYYSGKWGYTQPPTSEEDIDAYARYVGEMVKLYGGELEYVEIWNEPNYPSDIPVSNYVKMLEKAYKAVKTVDPNVKVVGVVLMNIHTGWMDEFFELGGHKYMDIFSIHTYDKSGIFENQVMIDKFNSLKDVMRKHNLEDFPLWVDEYGWSTGTKPKSGEVKGVTEEEQAAYGIQYYTLICKVEELAEKVVWYDFQSDGSRAENMEDNFGAIRQTTGGVTPWSAKPAYVAFTNMNHYFQNAEHVQSIRPSDNSAICWFKRGDGEKDFIIGWANDENVISELDLGTDTVDVYDMYGNYINTLHSDEGVFALGITKIPIYFVGDFKTLSEKESNLKFVSTMETIPGESVAFEIQDKTNRQIDIKTNIRDDSALKVLENNAGKIKIGVPDEQIGNYEFNIEIYLDSKLYFLGSASINVRSPINVSLTSEPINDKYDKLLVNITNQSNISNISGKVSLKEPEYIARRTGDLKFLELKPHEMQTFVFNLPSMIKKRTEELSVDIKLDSGYEETVTKTFGFKNASYAIKKPVIDGKIDASEWIGAWFAGDRKEDVSNELQWEGKADNSFVGNIMWDEEYFYLAFSTMDDAFFQEHSGSDVWRGDSVQFAISKPGDSVYNEYSLSHTKEGIEMFAFSSNYETLAGILTEPEVMIVRNKDETNYEAKIPWKTLYGDSFKPEKSQTIRFSTLVNDNDGAGRIFITYGDGVGSTKNVSLYVDIKLVE